MCNVQCSRCSAALAVYICKGFLGAKYTVTCSANFDCIVCLIIAFVCLLRDLHELLQAALGCIDHVAATIVALGENLNKLVALQT